MNIFTKVIRPDLLGKSSKHDSMTFAVKANIGCGHPASASTPSLREWIPKDFSPVVQSLLDSGHKLAAITNMHELAFGATCENPTFGDVENPHKPGYIAGGSSGGSAAAVAMNAVSFALGTDTGGSMLVPAALCGVVGYRPTTGLYSTKVVYPLSSTNDTIGIFANHVDIIQKVHKSIVPSYTPGKQSLKGARIGIPRQYYYSNLDDEVSKVTEAALQALRDAGAELVEADVAFTSESGIIKDCLELIFYETADLLPKFLQEQGAPVTFKELCDNIEDPDVKKIITTANQVSKERYDECQEHVKKVRKQFDDYFNTNSLDGFVAPTTILPALKRPTSENVSVCGQEYPKGPAYAHNTIPQAVGGIPCISIPSGLSADGCPIGLELVAPRGRDTDLLDLAVAVHGVLPHLHLSFGDFKDKQLECEH